MIRGIKTLFSKELKDLNKAFDDVIKMKKIDEITPKILTLVNALKEFAKMKVTQKAGSGKETEWVKTHVTKDVYANIYAKNKKTLDLCGNEWDKMVSYLHRWYRMSPTFSTFPWSRCKFAAANILTAYVLSSAAAEWVDLNKSKPELKNNKSGKLGVLCRVGDNLAEKKWKDILGKCTSLVKSKKVLGIDDSDVQKLINTLLPDAENCFSYIKQT